MKKLPYAEEIRDLRARAEHGRDLALFHDRVKNVHHAVTIIETEVLRGNPFQGEIPGDGELARAAELLEGLEHLAEPHEGDMPARLAERRRRLAVLLEILAPLRAAAMDDSRALHELQHLQSHELTEGEWDDELKELVAIGKERDEYAQQLADLEAQLARVRPLSTLLTATAPVLQAALTRAMATAPHPQGAYAHSVAEQARDSLIDFANMMNQVELAIPLTFEPMIPDEPQLRHRDRLLREAEEVLSWMRRTSAQLQKAESALEHRLDLARTEYRRTEDALKERMG